MRKSPDQTAGWTGGEGGGGRRTGCLAIWNQRVQRRGGQTFERRDCEEKIYNKTVMFGLFVGICKYLCQALRSQVRGTLL